MVKEKEPGIWSQKTRISTFLLVFDTLQDNYYDVNNDNNNCLVFSSWQALRSENFIREPHKPGRQASTLP